VILMMDSIPGVGVNGLEGEKVKLHNLHQKVKAYINQYLLKQGWLFYIVGFLLGRAVVLSIVSPFATAFLAAIWVMYRKRFGKVSLAVCLGAVTYSPLQGVFVALAMIIFVFLAGFFKQTKNQHISIPLFVFISTAIPRLFLYSLAGQLSVYEWMLLLVEGTLGTILVLIFMQSIPLLAPKKYKPTLKNEEIVCMIILIASILTGAIGWEIYGAAMEQVLSRYFVLLLALVGGTAIGSTVGVVAGLILSLANVANLYQMSLLAFSGLLGGLLKEGKKFGVSGGLLVGTCLVGIYGSSETLIPSMIESTMAIGLFFLTPTSFLKGLSRYIPGTEEHSEEQEQYLKKVRNVTAKRVEQFSDVFEALSKSFSVVEDQPEEVLNQRRETDYFLSQVTERTCQRCFMKERCWEKEFDKTYSIMEKLKDGLTEGKHPNRNLVREFENHCVKSNKVLNVMKDEHLSFSANNQLRKQVTESKRLVADQLQGVSDVMNDFAKEIIKEKQHHEEQELQINYALKNMGMELENLEIYQLEKGNVDIEMTVSFYDYRGEGSKLIAPVLSDILNEMIIVKKEEASPFLNGYCYLSFGSAKEFVVDTGVAKAAKGGGLVSGDSYTTLELGAGKYALAISDGMGNGRRAQEESEETLRLLQQILQTGMPERVAIKSVNSILALRTTDEMFATLDLAVINLHNAHVQFLKVGSIPSYIKRGDEIIDVEASNLPMGIIPEFEVDIVSERLKSGDLLVMMSDGFEVNSEVAGNTDYWLKQLIRDVKTDDPQEVADLLLESVIRNRAGEIDDDMTVLVARIEKNTPKWAAVPVYEEAAL